MKQLKKGFLYYWLASLVLGLLFLLYIKGDTVLSSMDAFGWVFYATSCFSHAAIVLLPFWLLLYVPLTLLRCRRLATILLVVATGLLLMLAFLNMQVYHIYRFHINGFILNMLTGPNAGDIFDFDSKLYLTEGVLLMGLMLLAAALWWMAGRLSPRVRSIHIKSCVLWLVGTLLTANACHVYGAFVVKPSVLKSARLVPYYFPLSASGLMEDLGVERHVLDVDEMDGGGEMCYPLKPINTDTTQLQKTNIVLILIDSWSKRSLDEQTMPHLWQMAHEEQWYRNHVSSGNGTSYGMFGLFTGLQPYYWTAFETSHLSPVLIDQLVATGYDIRCYPSATLENPPFHRILFQHVPHLRTTTKGSTAFERDLKIKDDLLADLPKLKDGGRPFFAFIFFDLLHAYSLPKELLTRFQPSWEYGKFNLLDNDTDPTPFWNLYRNSAYQTDLMVNAITERLKQLELYDNTLVIVTGDHSQEYNENHKNYWGHNSNFSTYQVGVPFIMHQPGQEAHVYDHRTTHYDFVPTLMHDYLGVQNDPQDYSAGRLLNDTTPRLWHFVGNELRYAFLVEGDTILTKEGAGYVEVTDPQLNVVDNYQVRPAAFSEAIRQLNRFFK